MSTEGRRMNEKDQRAEKRLDEALAALRTDSPSEDESSAALERVWERLESIAAAPQGSACAEMREELPALVAGELSGPRAALLNAHGRECLPCRRAQKEEEARGAGASQVTAASAAPPASPFNWTRFAAAAAVLATAIGLGSMVKQRIGDLGSPVAGTATLIELEGTMFSLADGSTTELSQGAVIEAGRWLRTGKGTHARIELSDGSLVEVNERSQVLVRESGDATTLRLRRGGVIIEAAPRKQRNLFVETDEMTVAVKGTIFSVQHGLQGSRVAVIEGSVQVDAGREAPPLLQPGEQMASRSGQARADLRSQVEWSRQYEQYAALLDEIEAVQASLAERPFEHQLRHATDLLDAMPAGTVFYAAIPNSSTNLRRFVELVTERLDASPQLGAWWQSQADAQSAKGQPSFDEMLDTLESLSESLGDEVVVALVLPEDAGQGPMPLLVARLRDEATLRRLVDSEIGARVRAEGAEFAGLGNRSTLEAASALGSTEQVQLAIAGDSVLVGPSASLLLEVADRLESGGGAFAGSDFHRMLSGEYRRGAETLLAFDLQALIGRQRALEFNGAAAPVLEAAGLGDLEHFLFRSSGEEIGTAVLSFSEDRKGSTSWLAEPAPMGSLEFVSPDATLLFSAVFKDPEAMLKDLQQIAGSETFAKALQEFRTETGIDAFSDIAAPLGGEVTIALDGPLFPIPAWKVVLEVYDPVRLQQTIERLVGRQAEWAAEQGVLNGHVIESIQFVKEMDSIGERFVLRMEGLPTEIHYTFADGYLVAAGSAHRLRSAIEDRELGRSVVDAQAFTSVLPKDGEQHFSLIAWQNLGPALGMLMQGLGEMTGAAGGGFPPMMGGGFETATLLHARAGDRDIAFSVSSDGAGPGAHLAAFLRHALAEGLQHAAEQGLLDATRRTPGYDEPTPPAEPAGASRTY